MKRKSIGIFLVLTAAISWGVSGSVAQYLFTEKHFSTGWLVSIRLLTSGVILLSYLGLTKNKDIWNIWKRRASVGNILIFGLLGMAGVQFTYFAAIETSNAATATLLQYLAPVLIILYIALKRRTIPPFQHVIGIITALLGTYFLVSAGHFSTISIRPEALAWGLSSAFFLALYTLQPAQLLKEFGSTIVVAWGNDYWRSRDVLCLSTLGDGRRGVFVFFHSSDRFCHFNWYLSCFLLLFRKLKTFGSR